MKFPLAFVAFNTPARLTALGAAATVLLFFAFSRPVFRDYFTRPNTMMYAFGGDALMLYYNTNYHIRYGEGATLRSMNYPVGEYIYLTDAQGAISNTLQWINRNISDITAYSVGFVNGINLYALFLAVLAVFLLLIALEVHPLTAIFLAPMIVLLSPQIRRMGAHFGLAYPFLIPLAMLWFLRKYRIGRLEKRDIGMLAVSVFFTFNNPYTGFNINFFLVLAGVLLFILEGRNRGNWRRPAIISGMGLLSLAWVFIDFKWFDNVHDRLDPQWGFFYYHATIEGLFHPPNAILYQWMTKIGFTIPTIAFEAMLNVGIITVISLVCLLVFQIISWFSRPNKPSIHRLLPQHKVLLGASLCLFLLAANTSIIPISSDWLEQNMGWLLMFKASGRLGWVFYFALTITAAVWVDRLFRRIPSPWLGLAFLLGVTSVWNAEINQYIRPHFKDVFHENHFDQKHLDETLTILRDNQVNINEYQAIMSVPKMIAWSDKILSNIYYNTQMHSVRISLATGLPMVNSMLSRIGLTHALERVQMLSHPLIERSLPAQFPNQKDILLIVGAEAFPDLKFGEKYVLEIAEQLAVTKDFSLYRLRLADLANSSFIRDAHKVLTTEEYEKPAFHLSFDDTPGQAVFYGKGSKDILEKEATIGTYSTPFERDTMFVFSGWTYLDAGLRSSGIWHIEVTQPDGSLLEKISIETRQSNDVQDNWLRAEARIRVPKGTNIIIKTTHNKPLLIDEVMLWPEGSHPIVDHPEEPAFLFENFRINRDKK